MEVIEDSSSLNEQLDQHAVSLLADSTKPSDVYKFLLGYNVIAIQVCAATTPNASIRILLEMYLNLLINTHVELSGDDLISLGVMKGPEIGEVLNNLLYAKLDGQLQSVDNEVQFVKDHLSNRLDSI